MRLDHLLSKELGPELGPPLECSFVVLVVFLMGGISMNVSLAAVCGCWGWCAVGFSGLRFRVLSLLQVAAASFVVVVMVVGVVVWELHSGREHLIFVSAKYSIILCSGGLHVCVSV